MELIGKQRDDLTQLTPSPNRDYTQSFYGVVNHDKGQPVSFNIECRDVCDNCGQSVRPDFGWAVLCPSCRHAIDNKLD